MAAFNPYDHFGYLTNRISRLLSRELGQTLKSEGYNFPASCIGILADLWSKDGVQQKDLEISLVKNKSTINKMISYLISEKLIIKKEDRSDKRVRYIYLTQKGKDLQEVVINHHSRLNEILLSKFTKKEITLSKKILEQYYKLLAEGKELLIN